MFLPNKYTKLYYNIINKSKSTIKTTNDGNHVHHIIPKSLGGNNAPDNLVVLSFKQHRICHRLLIKMTEGQDRVKMSYAYSWFGRSAGNYKTGKDNNFAKPELIAKVRKRMIENNPMSTPIQRERMKLTNHRNKPIVTPGGTFISRAAALRHHNFKHWKILYDLMKNYPDQYYWITPVKN